MYLNSKIFSNAVGEAGVLLTLSNGAEGPLVVSKERMPFNFFYTISAQANLPVKCKHSQTQKHIVKHVNPVKHPYGPEDYMYVYLCM